MDMNMHIYLRERTLIKNKMQKKNSNSPRTCVLKTNSYTIDTFFLKFIYT